MSYRSGSAFIAVSPSFKGWHIKTAAFLKSQKAIKIPVEYDVDNRVIPVPKKPVKIPAAVDFGGSFERKLQKQLRAALQSMPDLEIGVATTAAEQKIKDLHAELATLADKRIGVDLTAEQALATARRLQLELERVSASSPDIQVHADTGAAAAELAVVQELANRLDGDKVNVDVDADTGAANAKLTALAARANSLRPSMIVSVGMVLAPMAAPLLGLLAGAGGGLLGIAAGVAGGVGAAAAVGITALAQAVKTQKDLTQATKDRKTAVDGVRNAEQSLASAQQSADQAQLSGTRAVADAERALADARRSGAQAIADAERALAAARLQAARATASAQQQLTDAQDTVTESLKQLHDARRQAVRDLEDLTAQVLANRNAEEAASLSLVDAQQRLADVQANVFSSDEDIRAARLGVAEAEAKVSDARRRSQRDSADLAKIEQNGLDATATMQAAQSRLDDARVARAHARVELQQARADAARSVADAERSLGRAKADAARSVATAERNLARARTDAATSNAAAARQVAQAQGDVRRAEEKLSTTEAARQKLLDKLTPAQHRMLKALAALKKAWRGFLRLIDRPLGGAMVSAMHALAKALPGLALFLRPVLRSLRGVFDLFGDDAASKGAKRFAHIFGVFSGGVIKDAARGTRNLVIGFGHLLRAFMPLSKDMSKGLVGLTHRFRVWAAGLGKSNGFQNFIDWVKENGPIVLGVLGDIGGALISVGKALAPLGMALIKGLGAFARWLGKTAEAHPQLIRIAAVIGVVVAGLSSLAGILLPIITLFGLLISPIGAIVVAVVAFAAIWVLAYKKIKWFHDAVNHYVHGVVKAIGWVIDAAVFMWHKVIKPIFTAWVWFLKNVLFPVLRFLWTYVVKPVFKFIGWMIATQWKMVILPALKALWLYLKNVLFPVITFLWEKVVKPVFTWIGDKISRVWTGVIKPVFSALRDFIMDTLVPAFRTGVDRIGQIWDSLRGLAARPVEFLVNTVYMKGIKPVLDAIPGIGDFPSVHFMAPIAGVGGASPGADASLDHTTGGRYAGGGVLPGYTPGRDVHRFVSRTAGVLNLSGGEGVLIPQAVRQLGGAAGIHFLNKRARDGRLSLRPLLEQSHATGGIVYVDGEPMSRVAAAQLAVAEHASGMPMRVIQGSYQAPTSYSGTSHTGGGVMDTSPGSFLAQSWLRKVAFAAWARNILGAATAGSGAHVHSVSLIDPAAAGNSQAAAYRAGGDGLGGGDYGPRPAVSPTLLRQVQTLVGGGSLGLGGAGAAGGGNPLTRFLNAIDAVKDFAKAIPGYFSALGDMGGWGGLVSTMTRSVLTGLRGFVNGKIPGPGPFPAFDLGGMATHRGFMPKQTIRPERVLSPRQTESFERLVDHLAYTGAAGTRGAVTPQQLRDLAAAAVAGGGRGATRFDLYDRDGKLWTSMTGIARGAVAGQRDFLDTQVGAGMAGAR